MSTVKKMCICAICIALCYVLPLAFHVLPMGGVLSPMHLPVLLCGLVCGWPYGLVCGVIGPVLSFILSNMPPAAKLVTMIPELCVYGLAAGLGMRFIRTGRTLLDLYCSLLPALLLGRVAGGIAKVLFYLSTAESYTFALWVSSYVVGTLPAIVLQLVLLPALVWGLMRAGLIPARYGVTFSPEKTVLTDVTKKSASFSQTEKKQKEQTD